MVAAQEATLLATVRDDPQLYELVVQHVAGDEFTTQCQCERDDLCIHAMATLLAWAKESYTFTPVARTHGEAAFVPATPAPVEPLNPWHEHLKWHNVNQLRAIAKRHQFKLKGNDRAGLLTQIAQWLSEPEAQRRALTQLTEAQCSVLQMVFILSDGQPDVRASDLQQALGWQNVQEVEVTLLELGEWGLVVGDAAQWNRFTPYTLAPHIAPLLSPPVTPITPIQYTSLEPTEQKNHAPHRVAERDTFTQPRIHLIEAFTGDLNAQRVIEPSHSLPEIVWLARHLKLRVRPQPIESKQTLDALRHWPHLTSELVNLQLKPGWLHQAESILTIPPPAFRYDDKSLDALRVLTDSDILSEFVSQLLAPNAQSTLSHSAITHTPPAPPLFHNAQSPPATLPPTPHDLFAHWQQLHSWTELWLAQQLGLVNARRMLQHWRLRFNEWLAMLVRARRFVTRLLALLDGETWHDFEALLKFVHAIHPEFLRGRPVVPHAQPLWWLEVNGKKIDPQKYEQWCASYGVFISELIRGPLHWLGAVTLAVHPTSNALIAFRLTPLGAAMLHGQPYADTTPIVPLQIGEDMRLHVPLGQSNLNAYRRLERFARFERIEANHAIYHFTARQALAAFEGGLSADDILAQLEQLTGGVGSGLSGLSDHAPTFGEQPQNGQPHGLGEHLGLPLPDAVRQQWQNWWAHYAQVRWYDDLTLVEFADDYALQELLAQTDLREHLLFTFSPRLIALQPDTADAFVRQLVKKGYTPKVE
jgi:hypothetical protein